ncbi:LLM class flavin-dependent oxidoreductase [Microbacterium betulae]|uniref:LLM class flavin-dependent oxidoreductase n=1 Tax=Microbacterium betulae TaxID=2981139 RepID=A0AA97FGQ2_9MICO|nr:LLM class flavin-dependent oxidoreductase [Microbacterium sp. AB]WOF22353.1 LLM class flavin-dependent oxidoreductase [Microbacterium sp. AB]
MARELTAPARMHLALSAGVGGVHQGAWRREGSRVEEWGTIELMVDLARQAEAALLDAFFISDLSSVNREALRVQQPYLYFEPLTMLSALAMRTERIGLVATASTTFSEPYTLARQVAALDQISKGRAGWNAVTSSVGSQNFGHREWPDHDTRYERAEEFAAVVTGLWDSWEPDALVRDRAAGRFADPAKVHPLDHDGPRFRVAGPLNVPRSPQGRPVIVQAGSSEPGRDLAARHASMVFTAQQDADESRAFIHDIRSRAEGFGRRRSDVVVLPGLSPVIGDTEEDATRIREELLDLVDEPTAVARLADQLGGADLSGLGFSDVIPPGRLPDPASVQGRRSRYELFHRLATTELWTVRRLVGLEAASYGHWSIAGTAEQIADAMSERFRTGAADGFVLLPPSQDMLTRFFERVVPILQERGLFRTEYEGVTLREHLGVSAPDRASV